MVGWLLGGVSAGGSVQPLAEVAPSQLWAWRVADVAVSMCRMALLHTECLVAFIALQPW